MAQSLRVALSEKDPVKVNAALNQIAQKWDGLFSGANTWTGLQTFGSPTLVDSTSWGLSKALRAGSNFSAAGTGVSGSANQFGVNFQVNVTAATSSAANYEKAALIAYGQTNDPSGDPSVGGITRDIVGADLRGYIASTNSAGRAWGAVSFAQINAGGTGDGYLVGHEIDVVNNGTDSSTIGSPFSKYGLQIVSYGTANSTAAIWITQATSATWHKGIYVDPAALATSGTFLELAGLFTVDKSGNISGIGLTLTPSSSVTPASNGNLVVQATSNTQLTFKYKGSDGTVRSNTLTLA